jgi:hypothetical protein
MKYIILILIVGMTQATQAQFLKNIMKETTDKVADKMADQLSDRIADEIAYAVMKPINRSLDSMLRHRYESDSLSGEILYADYSAFLSGMNRSEDVPETYHFDVKIVAELEDDNQKKTEATFYYSKSGDYIGLGQDDNLMVMDSKNDLIVTYNNEDNMAYALPNMMKLGSIYAQQEIKDNAENYTIEKTGKKKKVSGYQTLEYKVYNADEEHKFYMAENFPVSWVDSYSAMMSEMAPSVDMGRWEDVEGMLLKSETKENGKLVSKMETVKVDLKGFTIEKKDYKFGNYQDN